ncbi:hypothetical protein ABBQ38_008330 [Trebouxia sp. C0009 RCD-2024]
MAARMILVIRKTAKIQATVRAYLARKWYRHLRRRLPPQNACLTRKWAAEQLQDNSGRLLKQMAAARDDLDVLFAELDTSLAQSKQIFDQVASSRQAPAVDAAFGSTAALSASSSTHNGLVAAAVAASALQVPAYVHVGNPLVVDEPHGPVSTAETERINWADLMLVKLLGAAIFWPDAVAEPACAGSQAVVKNTRTSSGTQVSRVLPVSVLCS